MSEKSSTHAATQSADEASLTETNVDHNHSHDLEKNVFTRKEKWFIVCLTSFAGFFSPLSSIIYYPVIPSLALTFNKSTELINLTVSMYMILQGVAPMVWGTLSDNIGRRPTSAGCLLLLTVSCVGLALVPTSAFWLLLVLRCVQAGGSASTIAIGAGVIADISTPAERAGFYGFFIFSPMVAPAVGPIIGGVLSQSLGWRSIFWFLCIAAFCCLAIIIFFMPETLLAVRHKTKGLWKLVYTPVIPIVGKKNKHNLNIPTPPKKPFQNPFKLYARKDFLLLLALSGSIYSVTYGILTPISTLFDRTYPFLDDSKIGFCFLAVGSGMALGSAINGKILDFWYQRTRRIFMEELIRNEGEKIVVDPQTVDKHPDFPIEKARLELLPALVVIFAASIAVYGWVMEKGTHISVPLILHIIMGYTSTAILNGSSTIMIDLVPGQGSAVTACNNLVRCLLGAAMVSVIDLILNAIGEGWTYILLAGITLLSLPVLYLELKFGPRIRRKRLLQQQSQ